MCPGPVVEGPEPGCADDEIVVARVFGCNSVPVPVDRGGAEAALACVCSVGPTTGELDGGGSSGSPEVRLGYCHPTPPGQIVKGTTVLLVPS